MKSCCNTQRTVAAILGTLASGEAKCPLASPCNLATIPGTPSEKEQGTALSPSQDRLLYVCSRAMHHVDGARNRLPSKI